MIESILIIAGISGMIAVILCVFGGLYFLQRAIDEGMPAYALIAVTIWIFGGILFIKSPLLVEIPERILTALIWINTTSELKMIRFI